ncbi:FG-GAP repeat protein [Rudanella lutea]|uniref:FG-GAP repeat protein n=1 Tax=Rudanella lutea TaxID=451374 RepID=UPI00037CAB41|nr:FG-GAP repeat protein [Rudanella lutea]
MKHIFLFLSFLWLALPFYTHAQIGLGGQPHPSAALDLKSPANDKVFYPTRLTTAQRLAVPNPQAGALVYDLDKGTLYLHDGQNWFPLAPTTSGQLPPIDRTASDGAANDQFGLSVAISGDYAIVGALGDDVGSTIDQGSAYIFVRTGNSWVQQAKLVASDGATNDYFGYSVAIAGDYALVGAYSDNVGINSGQGSDYVFMRSGDEWIQQAKLTATDGAPNDEFGFSVSIAGDYAVIGASADDNGSNTNQGSAYVFVRSGTTWSQQAKLTAGDGAINDFFGTSVAISGTYIVVGAPYGGGASSPSQGAAYVFLRSGTTWSQQAKLTASDGTADDQFGVSVALAGDYALVGAYYDDPGGLTEAGSAYVFIRSGSTWTQQAKLTNSNPASGHLFGFSVALSGNYALVSAYGENTFQGTSTLFVRSGTTWSRVRKVTDSSPSNTFNGISVSLSNGTFIIGASNFRSAQGKVSFGTID